MNIKSIDGLGLTDICSRGHTVGRRFNSPSHRLAFCQRTHSHSVVRIIGNGTRAIQYHRGRFGLHHQGIATRRGLIARTALFVHGGTGEDIGVRSIVIVTARYKLGAG